MLIAAEDISPEIIMTEEAYGIDPMVGITVQYRYQLLYRKVGDRMQCGFSYFVVELVILLSLLVKLLLTHRMKPMDNHRYDW